MSEQMRAEYRVANSAGEVEASYGQAFTWAKAIRIGMLGCEDLRFQRRDELGWVDATDDIAAEVVRILLGRGYVADPDAPESIPALHDIPFVRARFNAPERMRMAERGVDGELADILN